MSRNIAFTSWRSAAAIGVVVVVLGLTLSLAPTPSADPVAGVCNAVLSAGFVWNSGGMAASQYEPIVGTAIQQSGSYTDSRGRRLHADLGKLDDALRTGSAVHEFSAVQTDCS